QWSLPQFKAGPRNHPKATSSLLVNGQEAVGFHAPDDLHRALPGWRRQGADLERTVEMLKNLYARTLSVRGGLVQRQTDAQYLGQVPRTGATDFVNLVTSKGNRGPFDSRFPLVSVRQTRIESLRAAAALLVGGVRGDSVGFAQPRRGRG